MAGIAFWISFEHIVHVAIAYGEGGVLAYAYPGVIDGSLIAASLSMWDAARRSVKAPTLAWWVMGAGIAVSLAANIAAGAQHGIGGGLVAVWPSIALVGSFELLMHMARAGGVPRENATELDSATEVPFPPGSAPETVAHTVPVDVPEVESVSVPASTVYPVPVARPQTVAGRAPRRAPAGRSKAPEKVFAAEIARGELPSLRAIKERMHVGTDRARVIQADLASTMLEAVAKAACGGRRHSPVWDIPGGAVCIGGMRRPVVDSGPFPGRRGPYGGLCRFLRLDLQGLPAHDERATLVNAVPEGKTVKITFLGKDSTPNDSPTLYATDRDTYLVQGYVVTDPEALASMRIPDGETVVEVPVRLMRYLPEDSHAEGDG